MAARPSKAPLRAVSSGETSAPTRAKSVSEAVTAREELVAMRARIAKAIDDPDTRGADLSSLTRRLREIRKDIEAIDAREKQEGSRSADVPDEAFDASAV